jgi:hypothetical protein
MLLSGVFIASSREAVLYSNALFYIIFESRLFFIEQTAK